MAERSYASLLNAKVFADEAFMERLRDRFAESIIEGYLAVVADAEYGLCDAALARRIGVNRGQFTRYNKSGGGQRPSLRNFCLRSAAANVSYPNGALIAFAAYCEAFEAVAAQMEHPCPPMHPEIACCLYFTFRSLNSELIAGHQELPDSALLPVMQYVREYFPLGTPVPAGKPASAGTPAPSKSTAPDVPGKAARPAVAGAAHEIPQPRRPAIQSPKDLRELLVGRVEIWANLVHVLTEPNDWF